MLNKNARRELSGHNSPTSLTIVSTVGSQRIFPAKAVLAAAEIGWELSEKTGGETQSAMTTGYPAVAVISGLLIAFHFSGIIPSLI